MGVNIGADFKTATMAESIHTPPETIEAAIRVLECLDFQGKLGPIEGWEGDPMAGYMDILGLNGRPIRQNRPVGLRG